MPSPHTRPTLLGSEHSRYRGTQNASLATLSEDLKARLSFRCPSEKPLNAVPVIVADDALFANFWCYGPLNPGLLGTTTDSTRNRASIGR